MDKNIKINAKVFYLPTSRRPKSLGPVPLGIKEYWHVGILYNNKVYENFSAGKYLVSDEAKRRPELEEMGAEWQDVFLKEPDGLDNFLKDGLPCDNYVEKVLGLTLTGGKAVVKRNLTLETSK